MKAEFRPMQKSSLADGLVERLWEMIRSGAYQPGDRLPAISEMARSFGVGHPTLREALKQLEVIGVVKIKHGSGVYVRSNEDILLVSNPVFGGVVSKKLMLDLIESRIAIETKSVGLAARNATEEQLESMAALLQRAEEHLDDDDELNASNMGFHQEIVKASGNTVLAQLQDVLTNFFQREQRVILDIYGSREKDHEEHVGILDALRRKDPELAQERMRAHLEGVRDVLLQWDPDRTPLS